MANDDLMFDGRAAGGGRQEGGTGQRHASTIGSDHNIGTHNPCRMKDWAKIGWLYSKRSASSANSGKVYLITRAMKGREISLFSLETQ